MYNSEAAAVSVGDKLMGTLLTESENNKKYGDLKRSLISSIS